MLDILSQVTVIVRPENAWFRFKHLPCLWYLVIFLEILGNICFREPLQEAILHITKTFSYEIFSDDKHPVSRFKT